MPSAIPDRYKLEVRLGRDEDIEEWLATDTSLDRPVLIRSLGPESSPERRSAFVESVSRIAPVTHPHLVKVYAVEQVPGGAYAVVEWTGGSTVADHVAAGRPFDLADFLPNAAGLAGALAELHEAGVIHGSIDQQAISYSLAHPSKLGSFGRSTRDSNDVSALARVLETALTGWSPGGPPPSERIDGLSPAIDRILRTAQGGLMTARDLEKAFAAAPTPRAPTPEPRAGSRRLLYAALALLVVAAALVGLGLVFSGESPTPVFPIDTTTTTTPAALSTTTATLPGVSARVVGVQTVDPFGEGGENDIDAALTIDGDPETFWTTESYDAPLPLIKPGVGLVFSLVGTPSSIQIQGLPPSTRLDLRWAPTPDFEVSEMIAGATSSQAPLVVMVPPRLEGYWILWLTDLPQDADGRFRARVAEVRFNP
jgi:putative peptidoglycan lipid II flippase